MDVRGTVVSFRGKERFLLRPKRPEWLCYGLRHHNIATISNHITTINVTPRSWVLEKFVIHIPMPSLLSCPMSFDVFQQHTAVIFHVC